MFAFPYFKMVKPSIIFNAYLGSTNVPSSEVKCSFKNEFISGSANVL